MRILIVEDSTRISSFLRKGLEEEGYSVETSGDGDEAFVTALDQEFDAAVVDVMLPGRSGLELVHDLRQAGKRMPILLLTARDRTEDKILGLDADACVVEVVAAGIGEAEVVGVVRLPGRDLVLRGRLEGVVGAQGAQEARMVVVR